MRGAVSHREGAGGIAKPTQKQEVKGRRAAMSPTCYHTLYAGSSNLCDRCCPIKKCLLRLDLDLSLQRSK